MAVDPLATQQDVEAALGRDLTAAEEAKVDAILDKASELFRLAAGQQFTPGSSTVRVRARKGVITLPQRPVTDVLSVTTDAGDDVGFGWESGFQFTADTGTRWVRVEYEHGGTVPDVVRLCIADIAKTVLTISGDAASGVVQLQETAGPFSRHATYAAWAQGAQTRLAPDDKALAESFRIPIAGPISNV